VRCQLRLFEPSSHYALGKAKLPEVFHDEAEKFGLKLIYDVAHNIAKMETHRVDGGKKKVSIHRKVLPELFLLGKVRFLRITVLRVNLSSFLVAWELVRGFLLEPNEQWT